MSPAPTSTAAKPPKHVTISFSCKPDEAKRIKALAAAEMLGLSVFIRRQCLLGQAALPVAHRRKTNKAA